MKEYNEILTDLTTRIAVLKERRPSRGRLSLVKCIMDDAEELTEWLTEDVLEVVKRDIVLDADEGVDYAVTAETLQGLLTVELMKPTAEETEMCQQLDEVAETLVQTLFGIADELDRHHKEDDYVRLFEREMKMFVKNGGQRRAKRTYEQWREKVCLGTPKMEDLEDYCAQKLMKLFGCGMFRERVESMRGAHHYQNELAFPELGDGGPVTDKNVHKYYYCLRQLCDYSDGMLVMTPHQMGIYFYSHRKDENAKALRTAFLKYMTKVEMAQREMVELRKRRGMRLAELPGSRHAILDSLAELVGYGEWVAPATAENILEMLHNALGVGIYELSGEESEMSQTFWAMLEQAGNLRVVWQNLIGYYAEHRFFVSTLGAPALNEMFFGNTDYYQNIDKGRPSYQRKSKKWAKIQPLLDQFVPAK